MSISGSLSNAYSGLVAAARTAEAVSQNVSNALTEGFGRREVQLSAASLNGQGAGVRVSGVLRQVDQVAIADRRLAQATLGQNTVLSDAFAQMEAAIGTPGEVGSLSDLATKFETALVAAQSRPDSSVRLQNILFAAGDLAAGINQMSDTSQNIRAVADKSIATQVNQLNSSLEGIAELNRDIRLQIGAGRSVNGLMDQRQTLVDQISGIIPIKTYARDFDQIAITSAGGAVLLDGKPAEFGFVATGLITSDMTLTSGALSGLTMNGNDMAIGASQGLLGGGSLAALFEVRDSIATSASTQIDALARNVMERFEDATLDPTLAAGDPGLFTDAGASLDLLSEDGLAGRLSINAVVDPEHGGSLWRLRDGLGALLPADVGDNSLIAGFLDRLNNTTAVSSGSFSTGAMTTAQLVGDLAALNSGARLDAEQSEVFAQSRFQELHLIEMESGVDTDQEMQKLLLVEQAYAANARVIATLDEMLRTILEI